LCASRRDAIIKSNGLAERDFCVVRRERTSGRETEILYEALRFGAETKDSLGYIRYNGRKANDADDAAVVGTIDITNRFGTLKPRHLDFGRTTKDKDENQAGAHGEGLKVALIVLMRKPQNHGIRCLSGGFNWKFNFTNYGRLVARLHRMSPQAIQRVKEQSRAQSLKPEALLLYGTNPKSDVQFLIGETGAGRDGSGEKVRRSPVKLEDFEAWTKAALFLQDAGDGAIISTDAGDLLRGERLRGHIYLKGLLLNESVPERSASITNQPLKFGYNFSSGHTNRERQSVGGAKEEAKAIFDIWSKVLEVRPELVSDLSDMLNIAEPKYADVAGPRWKSMGYEMARWLKEHLVGSVGKWYYCSADKNKVLFSPTKQGRALQLC
jgi:hypothetical protein